ncbi:MAG: hypothetical protein J6R85_05255 [Lentisphaeria bacterium]|nr:hypothetical protein [Lentisphaeria bacterium]
MFKHRVSRKYFTANFRRDYIVGLAVVLFCGIVAGEFALAIFIPTYFVRANLWTRQMARQKLFSEYDQLRNSCSRLESRGSIKDPVAAAENRLLLWNLNLMADYLRANREKLTTEQSTEIHADVKTFMTIRDRLSQNMRYNKVEVLKTEKFLDRITADLAGK